MKYIVLFMLVLMAMPTVLAQTTVDINMQRYEPIPAQPGQYVTVYVEMENIGNENAPNAALRLEDQFPFTVIGENEKNLGILSSRQSYVESFRIRVDGDAVTGTNALKVLYTQDSKTWQETELVLQVRPNDAALSIQSISDDAVRPGDSMNLSLSVKNTADIALRNIDIGLDLVTTRANDVIDYPFIPSGSSAKKTITKLNPGESEVVDFTLKAYPQASPGYYKLPVQLTFYDESGVESTRSEYAGIIIEASPQLEVYFEDTTLRSESSQGTFTLQFVNKGINDLKFLEILLQESDDYEILSTSKHYLGDLDSDDYRSQEFTIKPLINNPSLDISMNFMDTNNKHYDQAVTLPLQYDRSAQPSNNNLGWIIAVVIVIVLVVWWFKRRRK